MPIVLTWNLYRGTIPFHTINGQPAATPQQRFTIIMGIAAANNVDIVALQEVPTGVVPAVYGNYTALVASENNPNPPAQTQVAFNYAILYQTALYNVAVPGYYNPQVFNNGNAFLRAPYGAFFLGIGMRAGTNFELYNWHNEVDVANATRGLTELDTSIRNSGPRTVVLGDFNLRQQVVSAGFPNWTDLVATYPANPLRGRDHILVNANVNSVLEPMLDFVSDAYHYPIAGQF